MSEHPAEKNQADQLRRAMDSLAEINASLSSAPDNASPHNGASESSDESSVLHGTKNGPETFVPNPAGSTNDSSADSSKRFAKRRSRDFKSTQMQPETISSNKKLPLRESISNGPLAVLLRALARRLEESLSEMLQARLSLRVGRQRVISREDYLSRLEDSRLKYQIKWSSMPLFCVVTVSDSIASAVVERMLGGDIESNSPKKRNLTEVESRLILRFVTEFGATLQRVYDSDLVEVPAIQNLEEATDEVIHAAAEHESVEVPFEVQLGGQQGTLRLCMPMSWTQAWQKARAREMITQEAEGILKSNQKTSSIRETEVQVTVTLATSMIRTSDLLDLDVGDIITTEKDPSSPAELLVQGVPKFKVSPGSYQGKKAVQITKWIEKEDD